MVRLLPLPNVGAKARRDEVTQLQVGAARRSRSQPLRAASSPYRSRAPLRVIGEVTEWTGHAPEVLKAMKDNVERLKQQGVEAIDD